MEHEYLVIEYGCVREIKEGIDKKNIKEIKIPEGVTKIGERVFSSCESLTSVTIPDGVTEIGEYAFHNCTSLTSVTPPASVTKIGRSAFDGCKSIASVSIPASVTEIGITAFYNCNIKTVQYKGTLAQWCQIDNDRNFVKNAKTIAMSDIADLKAITALAIPDGVTKIGKLAFSDCESLETVSIPASVTEIGHWAFCGCNIKTVQYRGTLAQWWLMDNDRNFVANAKAITMDDLVDLKAITALAIPDGVTKIGKLAFFCCASLATVSIPASVTEIGNGAFYNIKTVQYRGTLAQWCQIDNDSNLVGYANTITMADTADLKAMTALAIPDGVTKIGKHAFFGCESLETLSIPANVTEIGFMAFRGCNIKIVQYKGTLAQWCQMDNDRYLVKNAKTITMSDIADLKAMTALTIPKGVSKIGAGALLGCTSLVTVSIPASVTKIGEYAFALCTSLAAVSIPASVTEIGDHAFAFCTSLAAVSIPASVTKIGEDAFEWCTSLAAASIPESVTELCRWAFQDCESLREMKFLGTKAQWNSIVKGDDWNLNIPANKVVCADGEADLY